MQVDLGPSNLRLGRRLTGGDSRILSYEVAACKIHGSNGVHICLVEAY
jgi:hypothetical protein